MCIHRGGRGPVLRALITKVNFVRAAVCGRDVAPFVLIFVWHCIRRVHLHLQVWLTTLRTGFYSPRKGGEMKSACLCDVTSNNAGFYCLVREGIHIHLPASVYQGERGWYAKHMKYSPRLDHARLLKGREDGKGRREGLSSHCWFPFSRN